MAGPAARRTGRRARPHGGFVLGLATVAAVLLAGGCYQRAASAGAPEAGETFVRKMLNVPKEARLLAKSEHWIVEKIVTSHFPGAMSGPDLMKKVQEAVKEYGLKRDNVIYGQSIASDEINNDPGHISTILTKHYGRNFPMGGMAGVPYVGKTGFLAFSAHVPRDGHVFVLFGPHIGYSPKGEPGKFLREGQDSPSAACGAAMSAFSQVASGESIPYDDSDAQMSWLRDKLAPHCPDILAATYPAVRLAMENYKIVENEMKNIIDTRFGLGKLVLLGGIQINMPYPMPGFFMPLHFSVRAANLKPVDLLSKLGVSRPTF